MLDDLMKQLKKEYIETFPEKIRILQDFAKKKQLADLENEFHKMKGTGKTYGLPEMSLFGELFETLCVEKPTAEALKLVVQAVKLLTMIYEARRKDEVFAIEVNPDYKALVSSTKSLR